MGFTAELCSADFELLLDFVRSGRCGAFNLNTHVRSTNLYLLQVKEEEKVQH